MCNRVLCTRLDIVAVVRSNQRDYFHVSSLREQADNVLRAWFGAYSSFLVLTMLMRRRNSLAIPMGERNRTGSEADILRLDRWTGCVL